MLTVISNGHLLGAVSCVETDDTNNTGSTVDLQTYYPTYPNISWLGCFTESSQNSNEFDISTTDITHNSTIQTIKKPQISFSVESIIGSSDNHQKG